MTKKMTTKKITKIVTTVIDVIETEKVKNAIDELQGFFEADMWHSIEAEWKTEKDCIKYLRDHFDICKKEIGLPVSSKKIIKNPKIERRHKNK